MNLKEYQENVRQVKRSIEELLEKSGLLQYGDASLLEYNEEDPEEAYTAKEACITLDRLAEIYKRLEYLAQPVKYTGQLHLQGNGRYCLGEYELTSGNSLEILLTGSDGSKWISTRMEHNSEGYYLVGYSDLNPEGITARKRG